MFRPKLYPPSYNNGHYILPVRNVLLSAKTESTKKIPPIFRWKICEVLNEYCTRSTFHGLPYFVDRKRNWIERYVMHHEMMPNRRRIQENQLAICNVKIKLQMTKNRMISNLQQDLVDNCVHVVGELMREFNSQHLVEMAR